MASAEPLPSATQRAAAAPSSGAPWKLAAIAPLVLALPWLSVARSIEANSFFSSCTGMLLCLLLITVSATDFLWQRIYNWATYTAVGWMFGLQLLARSFAGDWLVPDPCLLGLGSSAGGESVPLHALIGAPPLIEGTVAGMICGFVIMFLLFCLFRGGAGDLKLVTAVGAIIGPERLLPALIYGYIAAGVFGACYLVWQVGPLGLLAVLGRRFHLGIQPAGPAADLGSRLRQRIALGPFLALGAFAAMTYQ